MELSPDGVLALLPHALEDEGVVGRALYGRRPGFHGRLKRLVLVGPHLPCLVLARLLPVRELRALGYSQKRGLLVLVLQPCGYLFRQLVGVLEGLVGQPPGCPQFSGLELPRLGVVHPLGHLPRILSLGVHDRRGVPLVLLALADLREPAELVARSRDGPGDGHARRGAVDVIAPERGGCRRLVYLIPIPLDHLVPPP